MPLKSVPVDTSKPLDLDKLKDNPEQKLILHVGCGPNHPANLHESFRNKSWKEVRLDLDPEVEPDVIGSITEMKMVKDNAVDAVWSCHNLEHITSYDVPIALKEFYRVLNYGGHVLICVPDVQRAAEHIAIGNMERPLYQSPAGPISAIDILYGARFTLTPDKILYAVHKTAFTAETMGLKLREAGFYNITVEREHYNIWATAYKMKDSDPEASKEILLQEQKIVIHPNDE
jgi:SAM-dependent methyltransferase